MFLSFFLMRFRLSSWFSSIVDSLEPSDADDGDTEDDDMMELADWRVVSEE